MTTASTASLARKRILISLDASARGLAALEVAVRLAISGSAELHGLFVEDEDLVRLAALPFAREIELASASARKLESANMERDLRAAAEQAQQAFTNAIRKLDRRWTFRIVRGMVTQASLAAAHDVDLLVIGRQGHRSLAITANYLPQRSETAQRVVAVFDGSPSAFRTIELGHNLAESSSSGLTVLIIGGVANEQVRQCLNWLDQHAVRAEIKQAVGPSDEALVNYVRHDLPGILLINRDSPVVGESQIHKLINEFDCSLILC